MTLQVVLWKWHQPNAREVYTASHVNTCAAMLARNLTGVRHRILCVTDDAHGVDCDTYPLWPDCNNIANATKTTLPSCYRRLKLYDPGTQNELNIAQGDRVMSFDLDALVLKPLAPLLEATRPLRFVGWALPGEHHPKVFNGSLQMFTAGDLSEIWSGFDPASSPKAAFKAGFHGSDQSWISWKLVGKDGCDGLGYPTIASYPLHIRKLAVLKRDTHIVFFHGQRKPWHREAARERAWVREYWR